MALPGLLLLLCLGAAAVASGDLDSSGSRARRLFQAAAPAHRNKQPGSSPSNPRRYTLDVTVGTRAPDCVTRKVILINGQFQPRLTFTQGDWVEVIALCLFHVPCTTHHSDGQQQTPD
ncbi:hypothetical protein COO60DRAFT_502544 [Scenedesmus sp. NREL 46B-D3]|nr:hypothetical protein COO60DRAFT_502544 [Scenedesmus sp. NREL 46B-D3]